MELLKPPRMKKLNLLAKGIWVCQKHSRIPRLKFWAKMGWRALHKKEVRSGSSCTGRATQFSKSPPGGRTGAGNPEGQALLESGRSSGREAGPPTPYKERERGPPIFGSCAFRILAADLAHTCFTHLRRSWVLWLNTSFGSCGSFRGFVNSYCGMKKSHFPELEG